MSDRCFHCKVEFGHTPSCPLSEPFSGAKRADDKDDEAMAAWGEYLRSWTSGHFILPHKAMREAAQSAFMAGRESSRSSGLANEGDVEWLHRFLNCTPFGPPPGEVQRAHAVVDALSFARSATAEIKTPSDLAALIDAGPRNGEGPQEFARRIVGKMLHVRASRSATTEKDYPSHWLMRHDSGEEWETCCEYTFAQISGEEWKAKPVRRIEKPSSYVEKGSKS